MHNGDAKPSCQVTRSLPEKGSHERLVVRLLGRHRMPQVPPARAADDEIHLADQPAHGLGTDQFPAQGRPHGTGWSRENAVIRTAEVIAVLPHGRQILVVAIVLPIWKNKEKAVEAVLPRLYQERAADDAVVLARLRNNSRAGPSSGSHAESMDGANAPADVKNSGRMTHSAPRRNASR